MSSDDRAGPVRGLRRAAALFGVLLAGSLGAGAVVATPAAAALVPTMTFTGVSVLGLLDSIAVTPSTVSVPSGGEVTFVNGAGVPLTLDVGGQTYALATSGPGATRSFTFNGASAPRQVKVSATALDLAVVGTLTSPAGTVHVAAALEAAPPSTKTPAPSTQQPAQPGTGNGPPAPGPGQPGGPSTAIPPALSPNGPALPSFGLNQVARGAMASAGPPAMVEERAGMSSRRGTGDAPAEATRPDTAAGDPIGDATTVGGGIGLLILVATVLLGAVGTAAIRTVLAHRRLPTGT